MLTFGLVVGCRDDERTTPPLAATVPNRTVAPLPTTTAPSNDGVTALSIAIEVDPALTAERWWIDVGHGSEGVTHFFTTPQYEVGLTPIDAVDEEIAIELHGESTLPDGSTSVVAHRRARARFVPRAHKLVYLYVDQGCAYAQADRCAADETCYEGRCRSAELTNLPDYRAEWRTNPPSACGASRPSVELGEGLSTYAPRRDGDTMTLECGSQGGHHLWLALRTRGLDPRTPVVTVTASASAAGPAIVSTLAAYRLYPAATRGSCEALGVQFQLDDDGRSIQPYRGQPLDITVEVEDKAGRKATVTRRVQIAQKLSVTSCPQP